MSEVLEPQYFDVQIKDIKMKIFFVYLDWTQEIVPRCFYVGKGLEERINKYERNSDWKVIADTFGWRREVVCASCVEDDAYADEKWLIAYHDTFNGWGANLNEGGRGQKSGWKHTKASRIKISEAQKGHVPWSRGKKHPTAGPKISIKMRGLKRTEETKEKLRESALKRAPISDTTRQKMSHAKLGCHLSTTHKANISSSLIGHLASTKTRTKLQLSQPHRRSVLQSTLDGNLVKIFNSIKEATRLTGVKNIGLCCHGTRRTAGGFVWLFEKNGDQNV